ncbi:mulet [Carabus blaptoides fortunei]
MTNSDTKALVHCTSPPCPHYWRQSNKSSISVAIFVPRRPPRTCVPSLLVLNNCDIATAGEHTELVDKCACVEELDLAANKLSDWPEVLGILKQMPRLRFVNLSFNKLCTPLEKTLAPEHKWNQLGNLVLNSTNVGWESVRKLLTALPGLEELHLSLNGYEQVELSEQDKHQGLRRLHFNGNPISNWVEITKLGKAFPSLESLVVANCPIIGLIGEEDTDANERDAHQHFERLRVLNMNGTLLSRWDDIERLARFPTLKSLRVQGCTLWESHDYTEHERRQLLIARLPNVELLNGGGIIEPQEREDAERAFIRYYMDRPESDRPERYAELVAVHGKLDPLVHVDLRPEKRVKVTFTCGSNSELRSVDVYRSVSDLKQKLEAFAGFPAAKMRLFYVDQDLRDIQGPEEMKYPHKQLYSYNIQSGDEFIVDAKRKTCDKLSPRH